MDYVFTDPPFGSNIFYSDMHLFHEAWLGKRTDREREAVIQELADPAWELIAPCALLAISDRTHHALLLEPTAQFQPDRPYFGVLAQDTRY